MIVSFLNNPKLTPLSAKRRSVNKRRGYTVLLLGFLALLSMPSLAAAPQSNGATSTPTSESRPLLQLGTGDVVNVQVYGRPELNTTTYVADDGTITVPLAGVVQIAGLSPTAAAQQVAAAFKKGQFLKNPQVTLLVTQSRSQQVSVLGEVRTPGRFPVESKTNLLDLLAQAGGTTEKSANIVFVIRPDSEGNLERHPIDLKGLHNDQYSLQLLTLRGGDSVFVPPADQFYIYGEVQAPNMYRLEPDMTVLQAISRSGGLTPYASNGRIEIKRRLADGKIFTLKTNMTERVQANDVIYVKESLF
ncbi:MAG: SLBB domain-containing protein [Candidatus Obscuribacterales bacterium]|nr:SLBB domain-containing protein [Steroidobacteraceae bacterium]